MIAQAVAAAWLLWYGYNGEAAASAFAVAHAAAPADAEPLIGELVALGPDLNTGQKAERFEKAQIVVAQARALRETMTPSQRALFDALAQRYVGDVVDFPRDNAAYTAAVAKASDAFPTDATLAVVAAEAVAEAGDAKRALVYIERARTIEPQNIMAAHLCLHEAAPRDALPCAQVLDAQTFAPETEHLAHMSAHAWIQVGEYDKAVAASERAWNLIEALPESDAHRDQYQLHDLYVGYSAAMIGAPYATARQWALRSQALNNDQAPAIAALRFSQWDDLTPAERALPWVAAYAAARTGTPLASSQLLAHRVAVDTSDVQLICEARAFEAAGNAKAALDDYARAIAIQHRRFTGELFPLWPAEAAQGGFFLRAHRWTDALSAFNEDLRRYPNDPRALRGVTLAQNAQTDGAGDL